MILLQESRDVIPAERLCRNYIFVIPCKRSATRSLPRTRSGGIHMGLVPGFRRDDVWMPASAGMTALTALSAITTQSRKPESSLFSASWTPAGVYPALDAGPV